MAGVVSIHMEFQAEPNIPSNVRLEFQRQLEQYFTPDIKQKWKFFTCTDDPVRPDDAWWVELGERIDKIVDEENFGDDTDLGTDPDQDVDSKWKGPIHEYTRLLLLNEDDFVLKYNFNLKKYKANVVAIYRWNDAGNINKLPKQAGKQSKPRAARVSPKKKKRGRSK